MADPMISAYMSSATTPTGYTVTQSSQGSTSVAGWNAYDGHSYTRWQSTSVLCWLQMQIPEVKSLTSYLILGNTSYKPAAWTMLGSNDGINWDILDTQTGQSPATYIGTEYTIPASAGYIYFRINITAASSGTVIQIPIMRLNGTDPSESVHSGVSFGSSNMMVI